MFICGIKKKEYWLIYYGIFFLFFFLALKIHYHSGYSLQHYTETESIILEGLFG